jgi:hypothetical protein
MGKKRNPDPGSGKINPENIIETSFLGENTYIFDADSGYGMENNRIRDPG